MKNFFLSVKATFIVSLGIINIVIASLGVHYEKLTSYYACHWNLLLCPPLKLFCFSLSVCRPTFVFSSIFMPPLKKGAYCFATVGRSVCLSVCGPSVVRLISFDPFTWSIPNLVQGLTSMSRWSLLIFRSHVQRSRSNHSLEPSVLSAQYLLTPSLDQYQTWC